MTPPILFDMDGIVLEGPRTPQEVYASAAHDALSELEVEPTVEQRRDFERHDLETIANRCDELEIDPARFWDLRERYASERTHDRIQSGDRGRYDDVDAIGDLARHTTIALVTNNRHRTATFVDDHFGLEFDAVRGRDPTFEGFRRRKPDPYYIEETLVELGTDEGIYVGDSESDVVAGRAAGLETAFVRRPHNADLECSVEATYEIESLRELLELV
ncbi:HAD family hydrolase [Natrarchaeobius oligotrophus]|uniref:HAD family hydrolase n=1 Tax=Natrarchaeobius chitinivorans TaxID=1679083 RepID=A0A3N6MNK8_NATCH|nr:HAD-IA family hydrolase [Natrarchaeobius chitinivorans]RQH03245.1 HAD family hydrolase [Natrarchaeobius chitinivorans]